MKSPLCFAALLFSLTACASVSKHNANSHPTARSVALDRKNCWQAGKAPTLVSVMQTAMQTPLEPEWVRDNFIQTFGCAYEEVDIEKNAIQAVYRAILQSLKNRNVTARDELLALLRSSPPRPDNLVRDYTIYVNMPSSGSNNHRVAAYEVKILQLEVVNTVESPVAIWTRVATRFRHREDHYRALPVRKEKSDFVRVLKKAQRILRLAERGRYEDVLQMLSTPNARPVTLQNGLDDLVFGDRLHLIDVQYPRRYFPAIFLGKGIILGKNPNNEVLIMKFGEERLFGLRLDFRKIFRSDPDFEIFGYKAPEAILQCLFLKAKRKTSRRTSIKF